MNKRVLIISFILFFLSHSFSVMGQGIKFDDSGCPSDPNSDGITPKINGSASALTVRPCQHVTVSHDLFIKNPTNFEWLDSVSMILGTCYTNITNLTRNGANTSFYANGSGTLTPPNSGSWIGTYNSGLNSCNWDFSSLVNANWGDGNVANYSCAASKSRKYTFTFETDISSTCVSSSDLNISIFVSDDGVGSSGATVAGSDLIVSSQFSLNLPPTANAGPSQSICNTANTNLAANTLSVGTGSWSVVSGNGNFGSVSNPNTSVTALGFGVNVFQWSVSSFSCVLSTSTVSVTRDKNPSASVAGANQTICSSTATLGATVPLSGSGSWAVLSGTGTVTTPTLANSTITGLSVGTNTLQWVVNGGACGTNTSNVIITQNGNQNISVAGSNTAICLSNYVLAANTPTLGTGLWTVLSGTGTVTTPTLANSAIIGLSAGTNVLQWTVSNGVCPPSSSTISITRDVNPSIASAGTNTTICLSTYTLAGNTPTIGTGLWSVLSGGSSVITPTLSNSPITNLAVGTNTLQWVVSNGVCPASSSSVVITRNDNPSISIAGTNTTICNSIFTLAANTPTLGTGLWTVLSGTGTVTTPTLASSAITGLSVGTNVLQWTVSNGVCPASSSTVVVTRNAVPSSASAGTNTTICSSTYTLAGNAPAIGTGLWSVLSGGGSVTTSTLSNSPITNLAVGTNTLQWTVSNGVCPASSSTVVVTRNAVPSIASAGTNTTICSSTYTLAGNTPTIGTGIWSVLSGGGSVTTPTLASSAITGLSVGTNTLQWTVSNGVCPVSSSSVVVTRNANPSTAIAGTNTTICSSTYTLSGNAPAIGTGLWSVLSGGGSVTTPTLASSAITGLSVGTNTLQWIVSNGVCPASSSSVVVTRNANPSTAIAGTNTTICSSTYTLAGNAPTIGTGLWSVLSGGGTVTTLTLSNSPITNLAVGTNTLQWVVSNGVCPVSSSSVVIIRDANPSISIAGTNTTICSSTYTLAGNLPTVGIGVWVVLSGGSSVTTPTLSNSSVTGLSLGVNNLLWTITNGVCPTSISTLIISQDVNSSISAAGSNTTICSSTYTLAATAPLVGTGVWTVLSGAGLATIPTLATSQITNLSVGTNTLQWSVSNGVCPASSSSVVIVRDDDATVANAGIDFTSDVLSNALSGNMPIVGNGVWTLLSGSGNFDNNQNPTTVLNTIEAGIYFLTWSISNGSCPASIDTVEITIKPLLIPQIITPNNDGDNDYFELRALKNNENIALIIFNRWGNEVYASSSYKHDFNGISNKNEKLIDDTYYYLIKVGDVSYKGYFLIKTK